MKKKKLTLLFKLNNNIHLIHLNTIICTQINMMKIYIYHYNALFCYLDKTKY